MPSGFTPSVANRQPVYVGDDTFLGTIFQDPTTTASGKGLVGARRNIITGATALVAQQSGSLCLFNTAAGYTFTLPAPVVGIWFDFLCTITNTSVVCKTITNAGTVFIGGNVNTHVVATTPSATAGPKAFAFDPAASLAINLGGTDTTTGGLVGSSYRLTCISATLWVIKGEIYGAGTIVTPAATS